MLRGLAAHAGTAARRAAAAAAPSAAPAPRLPRSAAALGRSHHQRSATALVNRGGCAGDWPGTSVPAAAASCWPTATASGSPPQPHSRAISSSTAAEAAVAKGAARHAVSPHKKKQWSPADRVVKSITDMAFARHTAKMLSTIDALLDGDLADELNARHFVMMLSALGRRGEARRAVVLHDQMISLGMEPNIRTFSAAIRACYVASQKAADDAARVGAGAGGGGGRGRGRGGRGGRGGHGSQGGRGGRGSRGRGVDPATLHASPSDSQHSSRYQEATLAAAELYKEMTEVYGIRPDVVLENTRLMACPTFDAAEEHLQRFILDADLRPDNQTLSVLIKRALADGRAESVLRWYDLLTAGGSGTTTKGSPSNDNTNTEVASSGGGSVGGAGAEPLVRPDWQTQAAMLEVLSRMHGGRGEARFAALCPALLRDISGSLARGQREQDAFRALAAVLWFCARAGDGHLAMRALDVAYGRPTFSAPREPGASPSPPRVRLGVRHYVSAIQACGRGGMGRTAWRLHRDVLPAHLRAGATEATMLACNDSQEYNLTLRLFDELYAPFAEDTAARAAAVRTVLRRPVFQAALQAAAALRRPDRAFLVLNSMHSCNISMNVFMVNHLLLAACGNADYWPIAVTLYDQRRQTGLVEPNAYTMATLLRGYRVLQDWDAVVDTFHEMEERGLRPTSHSLRHYLLALLHVGEFDKAAKWADSLTRRQRHEVAAVRLPELETAWSQAVLGLIERGNEHGAVADGLADGLSLWRSLRFLRGDARSMPGGTGDSPGTGGDVAVAAPAPAAGIWGNYAALCGILQSCIEDAQDRLDGGAGAGGGGAATALERAWLARAAEEVDAEHALVTEWMTQLEAVESGGDDDVGDREWLMDEVEANAGAVEAAHASWR